jgi:YHS domain-containing protein
MASLVTAASPASAPSPKEALQPFNDLIGTWRGTGEPAGSREERQRGFWSETIRWQWQFKDGDAWLKADIDKGKHHRGAELRWLPERRLYQLTLRMAGGQTETFTGTLKERRLTLERGNEPGKEAQRVVVSLLHANRYLYRHEVRPAGRPGFAPVFQVGATKQGVPFASADDGPECIVTGGHGTIAVTYKNKTYYVCCSGCRDAFNDDPETFVKEFEARKSKGK